jgi:integrase
MELKKNQKYKIEIVLGYNGKKKIRHCETFEGKKSEAKAREFELKKLLKNGTVFQKKNYTFKDLSEEYYDYKIDLVEKKTFINYDYRLKLAMEKIGYVKLQDLNVKILENFYHYLRHSYISARNKPLSTSTVRSYYDIINNMLEYAVKCDYIQENPNTKIDKPKRAKTDIPYYTPEEVEKLVSVLQLEPIKYQAIILLALDLGCRRCELTGLTWSDIDFNTGRVQINKTTQYAYGEIFEKGTKTANSERINYISKTTIEILKKWQKEQLQQKLLMGSKWHGSKRVFTTDYGADIHPDTPSKILKKIIAKYNLKTITFHGLRHTNVTLMIAKGIQTQIISRKVGHSSVQTTDRVYSHFFEDEFKNVPNVMEEFLTVKSN